MNAGVAAQEALNLVAKAIADARDLTPAQAARVVDYSRKLQCAALEIQRESLGIRKPKLGD